MAKRKTTDLQRELLEIVGEVVVIYQLKTGQALSNQNRPVVDDIPHLMGFDQAAVFF